MRARSTAVSANPTDGNPLDPPPRTLGDLLYADRTKTRVPEQDWVLLIGAMAAGDQAALHALYHRTHRLVFTLIMRITHNRATAEELTLDVFHDVWRRASTYDARGGSVIGWIMNQARSRAIDRLRFEQRKKRLNPHASEPPALTAASDLEQLVETDHDGQLLRNALTLLTPEERLAIETAFFFELTHAEVAARLNEPLGTIKTRIRSGLVKLRRALAVSKE
jgi:RNA polymerase sigma-70 factor (ECF subfamily)